MGTDSSTKLKTRELCGLVTFARTTLVAHDRHLLTEMRGKGNKLGEGDRH
jgi:hypothetical protein